MYTYKENKDYFDNLDNFYTTDEDQPQYTNEYQHSNPKSYNDYCNEDEWV